MSRRILATLVAVLAAGVTACGTSGSSTSNAGSSAGSPSSSAAASTASTDLCQAADDVRASLSALQEVDVVQQGTDALSQAYAQVKSDLSTLTGAAKTRYGPQVQQVKADADALQAAIDQAKADPSAQTTSAVGTAARTLAQDTQALLTAVSSSC